MANTPISMKQLRQTLRLYASGQSKLQISESLSLSRNTVRKYIRRFTRAQLTLEEIDGLSDRELYERLQQGPPVEESDPRKQELYRFFPHVEKEIKRPGVTRNRLWEEYRLLHPQGYGRTQFYEHYRRWRGRRNPSMHIEHKSGDKLFVDYAGKKLEVLDIQTGELIPVEVFVSILGGSQLIYVEATPSQRQEDFIRSVERAFHFYGGVPKAVVPDNLKSAVKKSHRYEPTLNETFEDFAEHDQTAVLPTRAYKPKDKALVEGAVKIVYQSLYAALRNGQFTSFSELNAALWKQLEALNTRPLKGRPYSRREWFEQTERALLRALPVERYALKQTCWATVMKSGHVLLKKDKHYYSVPYRYIGKKVKLVWSDTQVQIFYHYHRIATHLRVRSAYHYTTQEEHLASSHRFVTQWNPQYFQNWARSIGPDLEKLITAILEKKTYPEQAYRSCMGVLSLTKKVGEKRLVATCRRALDYGRCDYNMVHTILEKGLDQLDDTADEPELPFHDNIRGKDYYQ